MKLNNLVHLVKQLILSAVEVQSNLFLMPKPNPYVRVSVVAEPAEVQSNPLLHPKSK